MALKDRLRTPLRVLDGTSIAALRTLILRGPSRARKVLGATLHAARPASSMHEMSWWALARAFAVRDALILDAGSWADGCAAPLERFLLAELIRYFRPTRVLEIGTFNGTTTRMFLDNLPPGGTVFTIDLPPEPDAQNLTAATDEHLVRTRVVGADYKGHPRASDVVQVLGDTFEASTWEKIPGQIGFVFIDASHSYRAIKNDTEWARRKSAPDVVMAWHDYAEGEKGDYGVKKYIGEQMKIYPDVFVCPGTTLAFRIPEPALRKGASRIEQFFPEGDFQLREPEGALPWLKRIP